MHVHGPKNVGRAIEMDPTLLHYTSAITEQNKCWELLAQILTGFKLCTTTPSTCNIILTIMHLFTWGLKIGLIPSPLLMTIVTKKVNK